ncbi:MAG TPA: hypothetical protein DEH22_05315 [Chloroflexi bacterium]|nr:hypothetical protein [Chloroflexota bacterium]
MLPELTVRLIRKIAVPSVFIFWLLVGVISSVTYGLSLLIRGLSFDILFGLSFVGLAVSWWLARTRLKTWLAAPMLLFAGVGLIYLIVGKLFTPIVNLGHALWQIGWIYLQDPKNPVVDFTALQLSLTEFTQRVNLTGAELNDWLGSLSTATPIFHATAVLLVWGSAVWLVSVWAGWVQRRYKNALLSILPGSILLIAAQGYTYVEPTILIPLLFFALLLMALTWLNTNETRWKSHKIDYPDDVRLDSIVAFVGIAVFLVVVAFFLPRISIRRVVEMVRQLTNPQIEQAAPFIESFGLQVNQPSVGRFGSMLDAGLPRDHLVGAGPELSEQIVMSVQIGAGLPPGVEADDTIPLYWRGLTYDLYNGTGWDSSDVTLHHYRADQQVGLFVRPGYWIIEQDVRFIDESPLLFAAGDLITVDENYQVAWRSQPWRSEIEQFPGDFFGASTDALTYRAQSFVPVVDETTLRASPRLYPDWVLENYILVPFGVPQRVINLTNQLIAGVSNPYDRARLIEQYLRQFDYTTDLPPLPPNRDLVDYFLFDIRKGYCDYFATAMVVMARVAGLPSRLVVGYARGTYDAANDRYVVSEANAHSWPEIYFSGIGWVPFEPTSAFQEIARSEFPLQFPGDATYVIEAESLMGGLKPLFGSWPLTFGAAALGLIWGWMVWITLDEWLLRRLAPAGMATRLYKRLYRHGRRLGAPARKQDTPHDFANALRRQFAAIYGKSIRHKSVLQTRRDILDLTNVYTRAQFSAQGLLDEDKAHMLAVWQRLRPRLLWARGPYWLKKFRK